LAISPAVDHLPRSLRPAGRRWPEP